MANIQAGDAVLREMQRWNKGRFKEGQPSVNPKGNPQVGRHSQMAAHNRWHVQRGVRSEFCPLCKSLLTEACG
jgi:hypothetical protein